MWLEEFEKQLPATVRQIIRAMIMQIATTRTIEADAGILIPDSEAGSSIEDYPAPGLTPQEQEWSEKAVHKYAEAQRKKWQRWNESMFEPK